MMADIKKHLPFQFVVDEQILHKKKETRPILLSGGWTYICSIYNNWIKHTDSIQQFSFTL